MLDEGRFWSHVRRSDGCWEWVGARNWAGYGVIRVAGRQTRAHRIAYQLVIGPIPSGMNVLHSCDNPPCVRPEHLRVGTQRDNLADAQERGRKFTPFRGRNQRGSANQGARLTEADIPVIRARLAASERHHEIAADYGVNRATISQVARGFSWGHV